MAFIVEDGTGVTDANALITVAEFDAFGASRGLESFTYLESQKQAAIVIASVDYINTYFTFKGTALKTTQGLQIPTDEVTLVRNIKLACYQAALLHLKGRLFVDSASIESSGQVKSSRRKLGDLETEVEYQENTSYVTKYPTSSLDRLLRPYVIGGGMGRTYLW